MRIRSRIWLLGADAVIINIGFFASYLIRYGLSVPESAITPFLKSGLIITLLQLASLAFCRLYKSRFTSSWDLFTRVFRGLFIGTLLAVGLVYTLRITLGTFPTSIFILSFFLNLLLLFKFNQLVLRKTGSIKKRIAIIGDGDVEGFITRKTEVIRKNIDNIEELLQCSDLDEIVIAERLEDAKSLSLLLHIEKQAEAEILFTPDIYMELLPARLNGELKADLVNTFYGKRSDVDEFFINVLDFIVALIGLVFASIPMLLIASAVKLSSPGPVIYVQKRVGKHGRLFRMYKFRTMVNDAEQISGLQPAHQGDPRITKVGVFLRSTRLDELPQLLNILFGQMSIVGPRPENTHRVSQHKALQGLRLAVKPGLTGLAQIRSFYDLHPRHKIKYDYLYIQRRSLLLNIYIMLLTVPAVFSRTGV